MKRIKISNTFGLLLGLKSNYWESLVEMNFQDELFIALAGIPQGRVIIDVDGLQTRLKMGFASLCLMLII